MRYGVILPGGGAREQVEQGVLAEQAGWDGVFVWEAGYGVEPWSVLAAIAVQTSTVQLGTVLTPLPWRRPWKVASQVATLDQLSGGRAILTVGLGAIATDLPDTGEVVDLRERAAMLDDGIDLIRAVWSGAREYQGTHYRYGCARDDLAEAVAPPRDRIPIWVVGVWPRPKSMRRVLRCDGVLPQYAEGPDATAQMRELCAWLAAQGGAKIDVIAEGETPAGDAAQAAALVEPWRAAGATWWLETRWQMPHNAPERMRQIRERILAGPPRVGPGSR
jgi:alkanesulfonate monooxygenase SsuD/methylene tetrahydromethanopterin reductase-like flavin-dependent oxidoreductase (luciferase family)